MTVTNYNENNQLYTKYSSKGLEILGFPSPDFNNQEPGTNAEIPNCLKYVRPGGGYVPLFTLFSKSNVNGATSNPIYPWLKSRCGPPSTSIGNSQFIRWNPVLTTDITWNFEKFLLDRNGNIYKRYTPQTNPLSLIGDIEYLINGGIATS